MASAPSRTPPEIRHALVAAAVLGALTVAGRASRDSFFLTHFPASDLPRAMMAAAVISITGAFAVSRLLVRSSPARLVPIAFTLSASLFTAEWLVALWQPRLAAFAVYLHVSTLAPLVVSSFWAVINERFDPYTAKRTVARMAAAGALAGVAGGLLAERTAARLGLPSVLPLLALLSVLCAIGVFRIGGPEGQPAPLVRTVSGRQILRGAPLLRQMAGLMLVVAIVETLVDYAFKVEAAAAFDRDALIGFFALFYTSAGLLSFALQATLGARVLRRFGLGGAVALLPAGVALFSTLAAGVGALWAFVLARGAESVGWNSFFRSGFELLYTPVAPHVKRPAKAWVDVASRSSGEVAGATLLLVLIFLLPGLPSTFVVGCAAAACALALVLVMGIHRSYVRQLTESLNTGRVELRVDQAIDATTAHVLTESRASLDRSDLLARVRAHRASELEAVTAGAEAEPPREESARGDPGFGRIADLCSGDTRRIRRALHARAESSGSSGTLRSSAVERRLVPHAIALLTRADVADEVSGFLRRLAPRATGQLVDALLDADEDLTVRIAVARVLSGGSERRALAGLWSGLDATSFDLRAACARSAVRIVGRRPDLAPAAESVHARVERELAIGDDEWRAQGGRDARSDPAGPSVLLDGRALRGTSRSLEHVFTLLGLAHGREVVASALAALSSSSERMRGTALEFLETVLPPGPRAALWRRLEVGPRRPASERSREQIASELLGSSTALVVDRERLRSDGLVGSSGD